MTDPVPSRSGEGDRRSRWRGPPTKTAAAPPPLRHPADCPRSGEESDDRLVTIDAVRGFAVLGILAMNIVALGLPVYAYVDPYYAGGTSPADLTAWALAYALADGKMRALFTMLFGASMALVAERSARPATMHYRRMAGLFLFGMAHAWLLWFGDILVEYAIAGAILFAGWRWRPSALFVAAALCLSVGVADDWLAWQQLATEKAAGGAAWAAVLASAAPDPAAIAGEIARYRGGFLDALAARAPETWLFQTRLLAQSMPETLGYMAFGLALHRLGFLAGTWRKTTYRALTAAGVVALALYPPIIAHLVATRFDPAVIPLTDLLSSLLRPWLALGYAAAIILLARSGRAGWIVARLAAAGRMALTNYLATTLIATTLFYGYGFGLYARFARGRALLDRGRDLARDPALVEALARSIRLRACGMAVARDDTRTVTAIPSQLAIASNSHQRYLGTVTRSAGDGRLRLQCSAREGRPRRRPVWLQEPVQRLCDVRPAPALRPMRAVRTRDHRLRMRYCLTLACPFLAVFCGF